MRILRIGAQDDLLADLENSYDGLWQIMGRDYPSVPWLLLKAQCKQESRFNPVAVSPTGPVGIFQFARATWADYNPDDPLGKLRTDIYRASLTAFRYLSDLLVVVARHGFSGDDLLRAALGAYNQGQGRLLQMQSQADADGLDPRLWESILEVAVPVMVAAYGVNDGPKKAQEMQDYIVNILGYFHAYQEAIA